MRQITTSRVPVLQRSTSVRWGLALLVTLLASVVSIRVSGEESVWQAGGGGLWNDSQNWSGVVPNDVNAHAVFGDVLPTELAIITLDAPATVQQLTDTSLFEIALIGNAPLTFASSESQFARITRPVAGPQLSFDLPIELATTLAVEVGHKDSIVLMGGALSGACDINKSGPGRLRLAGDNAQWSGALMVEQGMVDLSHSNALGGPSGSAVVAGGELRVFVPIASRLVIQDGTLAVSSLVEDVSLQGGTVRLHNSVSPSFLAADSTGGTIAIATNYNAALQLRHGSGAADLAPFELQGVGSGSTTLRILNGVVSFVDEPVLPLLLSGRDAEFRVASPLLESNHIRDIEIHSGRVALTANNSYSGQTYVRSGSELTVGSVGALGTHDAGDVDATIVEQRAQVVMNQPNQEQIILRGGEIRGTVDNPIILEGRGILGGGTFSGQISGPGNLIISNTVNSGAPLQLSAANTHTGHTLIAGPTNRVSQTSVEIHHADVFQNAATPIEVIGGNVRLNTSTGATYHVQNGTLQVSNDRITDSIQLQGGVLAAVSTQNGHISTPVTVVGPGSRIGRAQIVGGSGPLLYLDAPVAGQGDLTIRDEMIVTSDVNLDGDLVVSGRTVTFSESSQFNGRLVLDQLEGDANLGQVIFYNDAHFDLEMIRGDLSTRNNATLHAGTHELRAQEGYIEGNFTGNGSLTKLGTGDLYLNGLGAYDGSILIQEGKVFVTRGSSFGSATQGVIIEKERNAAVYIDRAFETYEPFELHNATGFGSEGGLVLNADATLVGSIDLGDTNSIIGTNARNAVIAGSISGGGLTIVGEGQVSLKHAIHTYTGPTVIGDGAYDPIVALTDHSRLTSTSLVRVRNNATFRIEQSAEQTNDMIGDSIPVTLQGGALEYVVRSAGTDTPIEEDLGPLNLHSYASSVMLFSSSRNPGYLRFDALNRGFQATFRVFTPQNDVSFGGSKLIGQRLLFDAPVAIENNIVGGWALAGQQENFVYQFDMATYDESLGLIALGNRHGERPSTLIGADPTDHVLLHSSPPALEHDTTIDSLVIDAPSDSTVEIDLNQALLQINSGAVVASRALVDITNGRLTAGLDGDTPTLYLHAVSEGLTIGADIVDSTEGVLDVVVAGPYRTILRGSNTYTGKTVLQDGELVIESPAAFPAGGELEVVGGTFTAQQRVSAGDVILRSGHIRGINGSDFLVESGSLIDFGGDGTLVKRGPERVALSNFDTFTGDILVREGTLRVVGGNNQTGVVTVQSQGSLEIWQDTIHANMARSVVLNGGSLVSNGGRPTEPILMNGSIEIAASSTVEVVRNFLELSGSVSLPNQTTLTKAGRGELRMTGNLVVGADSALRLEEGSLIFAAALVAAHDDASVTFRGTPAGEPTNPVNFRLTRDNRAYSGRINVEDVMLRLEHPFALGTGTTTLRKGAQLQVNGGVLIANLILDGVPFPDTASLGLTGSMTNINDIPGDGNAVAVRFGGDFRQTSSGSMTFELADPAYGANIFGVQNDQIGVTQSIFLDGAMRLELLFDYSPLVGDTFDLLDFASLEGTFAQIDMPTLGLGTVWDFSLLYETGEVSVASLVAADVDFDQNGETDAVDIDLMVAQLGTDAPAFDLNHDGVVNEYDLEAVLAGAFGTTWGDANLDQRIDGVDLAILQANLFQSPTNWATGDFNGDGATDVRDFNIWRRQKGNFAATSTVPEPSCGVLLAMLLAVFSRCRPTFSRDERE